MQLISNVSIARAQAEANMQDTWGMLIGGDADRGLTAVAVGIAKLGEPAVLATHKEASSFVGTGRALSAAAGRLSYVHGLKVCCCQPAACLPPVLARCPWYPRVLMPYGARPPLLVLHTACITPEGATLCELVLHWCLCVSCVLLVILNVILIVYLGYCYIGTIPCVSCRITSQLSSRDLPLHELG